MINSFLNKVMFSKSFFDRYHSEFLPEMMGMHLSVAKLILRKPCIHYVLYGQEVLSYKILCVCVCVCVCILVVQFATQSIVVHPTPLFLRFPRQEYWGWCHFLI